MTFPSSTASAHLVHNSDEQSSPSSMSLSSSHVMISATSIQSIIFQNDITIAYLQQQDFVNAIESASIALQYHKELQLAVRSCNPSFSTDYDQYMPVDTLDQCMLLASCKSSQDEEQEDENAQLFVYRHGIHLPTKYLFHYHNATSTLVSAVLIFNSALSYHLYAQQQIQDKMTVNPDCFIPYLLKAKRLYELSFGVHTNARHNVLFQFAAINNIAVLNHFVGQEQVSQDYFQNLLGVLMLMVDQGNLPRLRQLQGFLRNLPFIPKLAAAA